MNSSFNLLIMIYNRETWLKDSLIQYKIKLCFHKLKYHYSVPLISYLNQCAHSLLIKLSMRMKECFLSLVGENNFDEIQTWLSPYILHTKQSCKKYCFKGDIPQRCVFGRNCPTKILSHKTKRHTSFLFENETSTFPIKTP